MSIAHQYAAIPYVDGGRTRAGVDCWGLVRLVLLEQFGVPWLAEWGDVFDGQHDRIHAAYQSSRPEFYQVSVPQPGDIACVFSPAGLCAHVGVVIPGDAAHVVLHTRPGAGVSTLPVQRFERFYDNRIEYWRYAYD